MDLGTLRKASQAAGKGSKDNPSQSKISIVSDEEVKEELEAFRAVFPTIINDVTEGLGELDEARKCIVDSFLYNVSYGSKAYCLGVVFSYVMIMGKGNCSSEKLFLARILSWCVHMHLTSMFMQDDIMDESVIRRRNVCWYRKEKGGMIAVNDICFMQNSVYYILKKYFSGHDRYNDILDIFTEVSRDYFVGQYLDVQATQPKNKPNLRNFTFEKYKQIVIAKATPTMLLTAGLALYLAGYNKEIIKHKKVDGILRKIGFLAQEQNDFLDCFGDYDESGKNRNDIERGKCTWFIVTALKNASESQLRTLEENYGVDVPSCAEKVLNVYKELRLDEIYLEYEKRKYKEILEESQQLSNDEKLGFLQPVMITIANHVYERRYACS